MRCFLLYLLLLPLIPFSFSNTYQEEEKSPLQEMLIDTTPAPTPLYFEEGSIKDYRGNPEFNYSEDISEDNWWTRFKSYVNLQYQRLMDWLFEDYQTNSFVQFLIQALPYLVLTGVLLFTLWIFNRMNPAVVILGDPEEGKVFLSEEEEIIRSRDIPELIEQAVAEENYRMAIRYYFLWILQELTSRDLIEYEFSKTDTDYLSEIKDTNQQDQFRKISRIYDYVWYGNFEPTLVHYQSSEKEFRLMQELIQQRIYE